MLPWKQCGTWLGGFWRSQLIWIYTVYKRVDICMVSYCFGKWKLFKHRKVSANLYYRTSKFFFGQVHYGHLLVLWTSRKIYYFHTPDLPADWAVSADRAVRAPTIPPVAVNSWNQKGHQIYRCFMIIKTYHTQTSLDMSILLKINFLISTKTYVVDTQKNHQWDGSFEHPKQILQLMNKKKFIILCLHLHNMTLDI